MLHQRKAMLPSFDLHQNIFRADADNWPGSNLEKAGKSLFFLVFSMFLCWGWGALRRTLFLSEFRLLILLRRSLIYIKLSCDWLKYYAFQCRL